MARFVKLKEQQRAAQVQAVENAKRRKERYYPILPLIPKKRLLHEGAQFFKAQSKVGQPSWQTTAGPVLIPQRDHLDYNEQEERARQQEQKRSDLQK